MTALPTGAATLPPVAPRPRSPPFSTITATAMVGFSAGAKAMYQACGGTAAGSTPCSAVPVFDAMFTPVSLPSPPVFVSDFSIMSRSVFAVCGLIASSASSGLVSSMTDRSGAISFCTRYGFIRTPPLAMVPAMTAFSRGVMSTTRWPMPLWNSAALSGTGP